MNRRGAALLMALWLLVVAAALALGAVAAAHRGLAESGNRIGIIAGEWAAEGCLAEARATYRTRGVVVPIDSGPVTTGAWCRLTVEDPGAKLGLNAADRRQWRALLRDDSLAAAVVDWIDADNRVVPLGAERDWYRAHGRRGPANGPLRSVDELRDVRGMSEVELDRIRPLMTTRGDGLISVNAASAEVLALLPGMDSAYARRIVAARRRGTLLRGLGDLVAGAPPEVAPALMDAYSDLARMVRFAPVQLVLHSEGHPAGAPVVEIAIIVVPTPGRLAVVRKEVW